MTIGQEAHPLFGEAEVPEAGRHQPIARWRCGGGGTVFESTHSWTPGETHSGSLKKGGKAPILKGGKEGERDPPIAT